MIIALTESPTVTVKAVTINDFDDCFSVAQTDISNTVRVFRPSIQKNFAIILFSGAFDAN